MKTNYRFLMIITLLLGFFMTACDEDEGSEGTDEETEVPSADMYFPPIGSDDWETITPQEIGWDSANLNEAIRYAKEKKSYNLLIIHRGRIVAEEYWQATNDTSKHALNSVAKSFMGFVIGVLQQEGKISIDDKVSEYLPAGWSQSPNTEGDITIRHLLTMTSGLNEDLKYVAKPGETWRYSHEAYKMLYELIAAATGKSYRDVFDDILFSKLGMTNFAWTGRDVASSAREIARFGLMIENNGTWNGQKLIRDSGYFSDMLSTSQPIQEAYGYLWWLNGTNTWYDDDTKLAYPGSIAETMPPDSRLAKGKHDQRIYVVPSLDLVVIRQGAYTALPESGAGSFDVEFWRRLMSAVNKGALED